jgi:2-polyprenyl-3-methyl-5-hydroxy-6-metoxy-1,4-benzoquinol methylase
VSLTIDDLVALALEVTGMGRARWDELWRAMTDSALMNRIMKEEWNGRPRDNEAAVREYYRKSDMWFVNTFTHGYGGLLHMAAGEVHPLDEWQRRFIEGVRPSGRVLDYGSGFVKDSWKFVMLGYRVDVGEIRGPVTEFLRRYLSLSGLQGRFGIVEVDSDAPVNDTYDGIICFETLEHILDPLALTRNLHGHLVPGAPFAFSVSFGGPEHAPYHIASNAPLGDPNVWAGKLREIGFSPHWENPENSHLKVWRRT